MPKGLKFAVIFPEDVTGEPAIDNVVEFIPMDVTVPALVAYVLRKLNMFGNLLKMIRKFFL